MSNKTGPTLKARFDEAFDWVCNRLGHRDLGDGFCWWCGRILHRNVLLKQGIPTTPTEAASRFLQDKTSHN